MKYLFVLVMLIAFPACAEWTLLGMNKGGEVFIEPTTLRKNGNLRIIWTMQNMDERLGKSQIGSIQSRMEIDCKNDLLRIHSIIGYAEKNAKGAVVDNDKTVGQWQDIPPNSVGWRVYEVVCN